MNNIAAVARDVRPQDKQVHICTLTTRPEDAEVKRGQHRRQSISLES